MKKTLLFFLCVIALIVHINNGSIDVTAMNAQSRDKALIESLFKERFNVWNEIYDKDIDKSVWVENLKKCVTEPLLTYDVKAFMQISDNPTDVDRVIDVEVVKVNKIDKEEDVIRAIVDVKWTMQGKEKSYLENITYKIRASKQGRVWKISDYEVTK